MPATTHYLGDHPGLTVLLSWLRIEKVMPNRAFVDPTPTASPLRAHGAARAKRGVRTHGFRSVKRIPNYKQYPKRGKRGKQLSLFDLMKIVLLASVSAAHVFAAAVALYGVSSRLAVARDALQRWLALDDCTKRCHPPPIFFLVPRVR
jgi:hypothetical protein